MPYLFFLRNSRPNLLVARQRYHSKCSFAIYSVKFLVVLSASGRVRAYTSNCTMFCTLFTMLYSDSSIHSTVMRVSHNLEIWSRDPGHAHLGVVVWLGRSRVGSKSEADISVHSKLIRVFPTFRNSVTWPRPRPLSGRLMVRTPYGSVLYVCANFQAHSSIRSKVVRGPKISKFGHLTLSHAPF